MTLYGGGDSYFSIAASGRGWQQFLKWSINEKYRGYTYARTINVTRTLTFNKIGDTKRKKDEEQTVMPSSNWCRRMSINVKPNAKSEEKHGTNGKTPIVAIRYLSPSRLNQLTKPIGIGERDVQSR